MQLRNSATRYGLVTKFLHWSIFLLVAYQFATGLSGNVDDDRHGAIGLLILALVAVRLLWRWTTPLPDWSPGLRVWERHLSHRVEQVMYLGLIAKPISGLFLIGADDDEIELFDREFGGFGSESDSGEELWEMLHAWSGYVLLAAIAVHVGLVLYHQFVRRDRHANRMLPFTRQ